MNSSKTDSMSLFQQYVYKSRYARFLHEKGRREEWSETVDRYFDFFQTHLKERCNYNLTKELKEELSNSILNFKIMPSMRAIMTAGEALRSSEIASYNCSYVAIDTPKAFSEILFILMNGVGVGFSVERQYVNKLPTIPELFSTDTIISVADSRIGWAKALSELISILYAGSIPKWDVSKLRPSGAILKTFGGRSSGPEPLVKTFNFIVETFKEAQERKLTSIECHDIICSIADCVIVGGVRRCLPRDTDVHTDKGIVKISDINIGDKVFTGKGYQSVIAKENTGFQSLWKIETQLGDYYSTGNHRWAVLTDQGSTTWKEAQHLTSDDVLISYSTDFSCKPVKLIKTVETNIIEETYDIEVENEHCFVVGGGLLTHNSALISLSNLSDDRMRSAKSGQWWTITPWRTLANNSAVYVDKRPSMETFMNEWKSLYDSKSGERGIFSRYATKNVVERSNNFRKKHFGDDVRIRNTNYEFGVNPCCVSKDTVLDILVDEKNQKITIKDLSDYVKDNPKTVIKVKSWNFKTNEMEYNEISFIGVTRKNAELLKITDLNTKKSICVTPDHLVWTENRRWVQAEQLESGDILKITNSIKRENNIISIDPISKHEDTYDITNPTNHNFFANDILVHNSEIILRDKQLCNLSEVVIREDDTIETLKEKIKHATILGTFQSTLTNFKFVSNKWKTNTEDERLLGVSLTGIMDNPLTSGSQGFDKLKHLLTELRKTAIETNIKYAKKLGIDPSTAITAIKPSGCTSLNTKIKTQNGIKSMEEIWNELAPDVNIYELNSGDWVEPIQDMMVYDENNMLQKITKLYMNGISEVYEIEDEEGNKYKFTAEHKLKTINGWKRVDELSEDDEILKF